MSAPTAEQRKAMVAGVFDRVSARDECYAILAPEVRDNGSVALRQYLTYTVATV